MSRHGSGPVSGGRDWYGGFVSNGRPSLSMALSDMVLGLVSWRIWLSMAMSDIRQKYRGSILGPLWVTISMAAFTVGIGAVYANLFKMDLQAYLPHVAIGMVTWTLITGLVNESCVALIGAEGFLRQMRLPLTVFIYRTIARNTLVLLHHALIIVGVLAWYGIAVGPGGVLLALLAVLLLLVTGFGWGLALACICMRFRDVAQIVATMITGAFFVTPVLWKGHLLVADHPALLLNPFYYLLEILRQPLTIGVFNPQHWLVSAGIALLGLLTGILVFRVARPRVTYWI